MLREIYTEPARVRLIRRYWQAASGFWSDANAWRAWLLGAALTTGVLLMLLLQYRLNYWNRDFFNALGRKDSRELWTQILAFIPLAMAIVLLSSFSIWGRMTLQRTWRAFLSRHLYKAWLNDDHLRRLRDSAGNHQTPEYRIAEDARVATDAPIDLALGLFSAALTAITFIGILWTVGGSLQAQVYHFVVIIPGYLVFACMAYSLSITSLMMVVGRNLTRVIEGKNQTEADLRSVGSQLREIGETQPPGDHLVEDRIRIDAALDATLNRWLQLAWLFTRMNLISYGSTVITPIVALALCLPKYVDGTLSLGEVVQGAAAFVMVQIAFNWITDSYARIAEWTSSANRVASLLLALDKLDQADLAADADITEAREPELQRSEN
jgi:putative ATP-binding cassette transporter